MIVSKKYISIAAAAGFLMVSCSSNTETGKNNVEKMMCDSLFGEKGKDFRMVSFGDGRENIPLGDGPNIMENEPERLVERILLNNADSTYAEVFYLFAENRLSEAEINVITKSDSVLASISDSITTSLSRRFGKPMREGGFNYWTGQSVAGYRIEVYLSNRSGEFRMPTLQIVFRAELVETPRMAFAY